MSDVQIIENYLSGELIGEERVVMEARLLIEPELQEKLKFQQQTYALITVYGRECLKREIEIAHQYVFRAHKYSRFRTKIYELFNRKI